MKIALVVKKYSPSWGGVERMSVGLGAALKRAGHEVRIYAETIEGERDPAIAYTEVPVTSFISALKVLSFHRNVARLLARETHDVVLGLCQFFPLDVYRAGGGVHRHWMRLRYENGLVRAIKYVTSPVHLVMARLEGRIMEQGNHRFIIANSKLVKEHILGYFNVGEDKVRVIYNGVDHALFNPGVKSYREEVRGRFGIPGASTVALFVSNNWERKGLTTVLKAMKVAGGGGISLLVVGRGRKEKFLKLIDALGIERDSVIFAGPTGHVERFYGAADLFVLPTRYDPASGVCLEAMACSLPVVTTSANGASELIEEGKNGFILRDWSDHEGLAGFFAELKDKSRREEFGRRASEKMKGFTWDRTASEIIEVCGEVVKKKGVSRSGEEAATR